MKSKKQYRKSNVYGETDAQHQNIDDVSIQMHKFLVAEARTYVKLRSREKYLKKKSFHK